MSIKTFPPHRPRKGRGGVFLGGGLFSGGLCALLLAGCGVTPPNPLATNATPSPAAQKRGHDSDKYRSVNQALSKLDAKTVQAWINRWTAPGGASKSGTPRAVRIDIDSLAHRHPAWLLANALETGAVSPQSPQVSAVLATGNPAVNLATSNSMPNPIRVLPARVVSDGFNGAAARKRQSDALDRFFASTAARDALRGRDEAYLARRDLEDAITAAQRGAVAELDLTLVPPDVALELTNLRLQLLRSLSRTPEQRAASRAKIQAIQTRFNELWKQQTDLQAARLREATIDLPARLRREGLARIDRDSVIEGGKRSTARAEVDAQTKAGLGGDFQSEAHKLRLVLPPTRRVGSVTGQTEKTHSQFFETSPPPLPSAGARNQGAIAAQGPVDPKITTALRLKARREARQWATLVAARLGSRLDNHASNPDRTAAAIAILFPASRG